MATGFRIRLTPEQRDELHRRARARVIPPRLRDQPRPGRPPTLTAAHLGAVEALLDAAAARGETWTAPRLAAWLAETQAVWIDAEHLAARLRARKFRWKRTKRSVQHKADPHLQEQARADLEVLTF